METDGIELSGGQRQKLAVSRAAICDADMIILDEPTASMDPMSESEILDAFSRMYRNKTLLIVSHRLSAAVKMDRVIFIERGRVSGIGTHKILYFINCDVLLFFQAGENTFAERFAREQYVHSRLHLFPRNISNLLSTLFI